MGICRRSFEEVSSEKEREIKKGVRSAISFSLKKPSW
jgi:hypothetical protein